MTRALSAACLLFFASHITAQQTASFNQNSSRSNRSGIIPPNATGGRNGFSFSFTPYYATGINKNSKPDTILFRGNGAGIAMNAAWQFGNLGLGVSGGFLSAKPDHTEINEFIKRTGASPDQLQINTGNQQNMYLLMGPELHFGKTISAIAHIKGGLFINNSGLVNIQQKGALRSAYRNEPSSKSVFPGYSGGIALMYNSSSPWSFGFSAEFLSTRAEIINYDSRRGAGIEGLKLSKNISNILAGISIRHSITSPRDVASGQASGKRSHREAGSGMATGKRNLQANDNSEELVSPRDAASGQSTGRRQYEPVKRNAGGNESCGPVTEKVTNPDGTTEEMTFACPEDAIAYKTKLAKQKAWLTSNFKRASNTDAAKGIISGRVTWSSSAAANAIITNKTTRGGSVTMNSQTSNTRQTPQSSFGTLVRNGVATGAGAAAGAASISNAPGINGITTKMYAREAGSGMASGKRSQREAGSGMATGRRQYEPVFIENGGEVCNPCAANVVSNPMYNDKGNAGNNPLNDQNKRTNNSNDKDCDGIEGLNVYLINAVTEEVMAVTQTETCGGFFFAKVPSNTYIIKVSGEKQLHRSYDVSVPENNAIDMKGGITMNDERVAIAINTGGGNNPSQKAGISTSRSNLRTKSYSIIEADLDGDGEFETLKIFGAFSDGNTKDVTAEAIVNTSRSNIKQIVLPLGNASSANNQKAGVNTSRSNIKNITVAAGDVNGDGVADIIATGTFSDGSTRDITQQLRINTVHSSVKQYDITVADTDGDGAADLIWSPKSNTSLRVAPGDVSGDAAADKIQSYRVKTLEIAEGDINGDGAAELLVGGALPGGAVLSSALKPGNPIKGIVVKGGKNTGGNFRSVHTDENGEFEFSNVEAGNYRFAIDLNYIINDETLVVLDADTDVDAVQERKGWDGTIKGNPRQTSQLNVNERKGWDGTVKGKQTQGATFGERTIGPDMEPDTDLKKEDGEKTDNPVTKAQNNNTVRSNRIDNAIIDIDSDGDGEFETSIINFNSELATFSISEKGSYTLRDGIKQTMQQQVRASNNNNSGPIKWMAPETLRNRVHGDPHVDQKDGSLKIGEGAFGKIYKHKWRSADVAVKTIRCADGSYSIISANPADFPDQTQAALNTITGDAVNNAEVWFTDSNGKTYKKTTDAAGRISLNGLPPGTPITIRINIMISGDEDVMAKFTDGTIQLTKARHDIAMNAIRNMK
ncbi:MAG: hypothetical protein SFU87_03055 [Chitinophagaceae bacterium]|nr:hypothetical protein [Chitinophagaceae bacterium]